MIFMGTQWLPYNKTEEWAEIFLKVNQKPLPSCIKKWQTFSSADGENGIKGIALGKRPDLTGGGLIRSMGGWSIVKAMRTSDIKEESDARILGSGQFVSEMIRHAEEKVKYQLPALELQKSIKEEIGLHCRNEKVPVAMLQSGSRRPPLPKLRRAIALKLINEYGVSLAETARHLGISTSGVAQILRRSGGV